jgi:TonB family protein
VNLPKVDLAKLEPPAPRRLVVTGGFRDPNGATPSPAPPAQNQTVAKLGAFDVSPASAHGAGTAENRRVAAAGFGDSTTAAGSASNGNGHGSVRTAGFGDGPVAEASGSANGHGFVRNAGFNEPVAAPAPSPAARPLVQAETPVEITFKPKPSYTPEARQRRVEGEVLLEVLFSASGRIQVLRVARGLGFGLDETAREAASQIRFQPGTRAGAPIDMKGTIHIVFALS